MKTDIEKLKALLVEYGMAKVGGYSGFFAAFVFDGLGKFINVEVGE